MKKKHDHSVFLCWRIFFFKFEKSVFQFCDIIVFEKMSKISQFKIRKPKNSKTSQNVLLKNPQKSIRKKIHWASQ